MKLAGWQRWSFLAAGLAVAGGAAWWLARSTGLGRPTLRRSGAGYVAVTAVTGARGESRNGKVSVDTRS